MTVEGTVRSAGPEDVAAVAALQAAAWRACYTDVLPSYVLAELTADALADRWRAAVESPPTPRHRVLVARSADAVAGFAAVAPTEDGDLDPAVDAELLALVVERPSRGRGHGSRLLQAAADLSREAGVRTLRAWLGPADDRLRAFLVGAGWGPDGAGRALDLRGDGQVVVRQLRLHTGLEERGA